MAVGESDEVLPCCCFLLPILLITHTQFKYSTKFTKSPSRTIFLQYQQYSLVNHHRGQYSYNTNNILYQISSLDPNISGRLTGSIIPDSGFSPADVLLNSFLAGEANLLCVSTDSSLLLRRWMWQRWVGRSCSTIWENGFGHSLDSKSYPCNFFCVLPPMFWLNQPF